MGQQHRRKLIVFSILGIILFSLCSSTPISAEDTGSISVSARIQVGNDEKKPLPDMEFVLYQVGYEDHGEWKLSEAYKESGIILNMEDADALRTDAASLYQYIKEHNIKGVSKSTGKYGTMIFDNLEKHLYLLAQSKGYETQTAIYHSAPVMIAVPSVINEKTIWNVAIESKFEIEIKPNNSTTEQRHDTSVQNPTATTSVHKKTDTAIKVTGEVKTGDEINFLMYFLLLGLALVDIVLCTIALRKED